MRRLVVLIAPALVVVLVGLSAVPEALAWPHQAQRGHYHIYSEAPIGPELERVLARSESLLARSPVHQAGEPRRLFLSQGGWRWHLLALTSRNAFALRRPFRSAIVLNRSDVAADRITRSLQVGGVRTLSGVIAHEITHVDVAQRYGELHAAALPTWLSEGYADHVAQESSLTAEQVAALRAAGTGHPALIYFEGRERVAAALAANGGDVDTLMQGE